jgi:hypothetical protein
VRVEMAGSSGSFSARAAKHVTGRVDVPCLCIVDQRIVLPMLAKIRMDVMIIF